MAEVVVNLALARSFWTRAILEERVQANGIQLNAFVAQPPYKRHESMRNGEYDAAEVGLSGFLSDRALGLGSSQLALPVWPQRGLRHRNIVTRIGSRIRHPGDLKGGRVGSIHYSATTNIWARQLLADEYGVGPHDATWVVTEADENMAGTKLPIEILNVADATSLVPLWEMLERDELDAVISPGFNWFYATFRNFSAGMGSAEADAGSRSRPNRPDVVELPSGLHNRLDSLVDDTETCLEYVRRTKVYPLGHAITVREELVSQHPWIAESLVELFRAAGELALAYMTDEDRDLMERERDGFGFDPHAHGWSESTERTTDTLVRTLVQQELLPRALATESFMVPGYREL